MWIINDKSNKLVLGCIVVGMVRFWSVNDLFTIHQKNRGCIWECYMLFVNKINRLVVQLGCPTDINPPTEGYLLRGQYNK